MADLRDENHAEMTERYGRELGHYLADALSRTGCDWAEETMLWFSFKQTFASTALMSGGIGGAAITAAQVYAVLLEDGMYVYCGGHFAYRMERGEGMDCVRALCFPERHPRRRELAADHKQESR